MSFFSTLVRIKKAYLKRLALLKEYKPWIAIPDAFTKEECQAIISLGLMQKLHDGKVEKSGGGFGVHKEYRDVKTGKIELSKESEWLYRKLKSIIDAYNKKHYGFDLIWFQSDLQFLKYSPEGRYWWHTDIGQGPTSNRKISVSLQLTDENEYEGGDFEFFTNVVARPSRKQGTLLLFPSYISHRVMPVKKGERYALVGWMCGPTFE